LGKYFDVSNISDALFAFNRLIIPAPNSIQTGIGVPHISGKQILSFPFRKPHLKKQQQIVKS
jgi:restriction endonuclease S subunit|tara:strand:+ start:227 stop:412 length:186 start_codon:yes stop_codon:yes gene_type:complete